MLRSCLFYMLVSAAIHVSEALFHKGSDELYALRYSIPGGGIPGQDYPILAAVPDTEFSCEEENGEGYYPDPSTFCQVFHICHQGITWTKDSFLCPNGTIFNTNKKGCGWWFDSECSSQLAQSSRVIPRISHGLASEKSSLGSGFVRKTLPLQTPDVSPNQYHSSFSKENGDAVYHPVSDLLASQKHANVQHLGLHDIVRSSHSDQNDSPAEGSSVVNHFQNTEADIKNIGLSETQSNTFIHSSNPNGFSYSFTTNYESPTNNPSLKTSIIREPPPTFSINQPESIDFTNKKVKLNNEFDGGFPSSHFDSNVNNARNPSFSLNSPSLPEAEDSSFSVSSDIGYSSQGVNGNANPSESADNFGFGVPIPGVAPDPSGIRPPSFGFEENAYQPGATGQGVPLPESFAGSGSDEFSSLRIMDNIQQPEYTGVGIPLPGIKNGFDKLESTAFDFPSPGHVSSTSGIRKTSFELEGKGGLPEVIGQGAFIPEAYAGSTEEGYSSPEIKENIGQPGITGIGIPLPENLSNFDESSPALQGTEESYGLDVNTGLGASLPNHNESLYSPLGIENNIHSVWQTSSNEENNQIFNTDTHSGVDHSFNQVGISSSFGNPSNGVLSGHSTSRGIPVECRQTRTSAELSPELSSLRTNIWGNGIPGVDYPVLSSIIRTRFLCQDYAMDGFYADPEACCQVFHRCFNRGRGWWEQESFLCPNGTIFNQKVNICIRWNEPYWWDGVSCSESEKFYPSALANETEPEGFVISEILTRDSEVGSDINPNSNTRVTDITDVDTSNSFPSNNLPNFAAGDTTFDDAWAGSPSDFTGRAVITPNEHNVSHLDPSNFTYNEPDPAYALSVSFGAKNDAANNGHSSIDATSFEDIESTEGENMYKEYEYTNIGNEFTSNSFNGDTNYDVNFNTNEGLDYSLPESTLSSEIFFFHNINEFVLETNKTISFIENANNFQSNTDHRSPFLDLDETTELNHFTKFHDEVESKEEMDYYYDSQVDFQHVQPMVNNLSPKPIDDKGNPVLHISPTVPLEPSFTSAMPSTTDPGFTWLGPDKSYTIAATFGADSSLSDERINIITISSAGASNVSPVSAASNPSLISISIKPSTVYNDKSANTETNDFDDFGAEFW